MTTLARPQVPKTLTFSLIAAAVLTACGGPEERMARAMDRGQDFLAERDFDKARVEFSNALQVDPNHEEAIYFAGRAAEGLQDYRNAAGAYRTVLDNNPLHLPAMASLARMMVFAGEAEMAMDEIAPGLEVDAANPGLLTVRAAAYAALGNMRDAQTDAEAVIAVQPDNQEAAALLAGLYRASGDTPRAIALIERALETRARSTDLRLILAQLYQSNGEAERAEQEMVSLVALEPDEIGHRNRLAQYYLATGRVDQAEGILRENIEREPDVVDHKVTLINFINAQESWDAAEAQLQSFVGNAPDDATLRLALAQFYDANGYEEDADAVFNAVIEMAASDEVPALAARNRLAERLLSNGDTEAGERMLEEVIAANPRDVQALTMRGTLRLSRNELFDAITDFRSVLRDVPEAPTALLGLARAHARNAEPDLAADAYRLLVSVNPTDVDARIEAAQYLNDRGSFDDAEAMLSEAIGEGNDLPMLETLYQTHAADGDIAAAAATAERIMTAYPQSPVGFFLFGRTREAAGEVAEAETLYRRALELNPRGAEPLQALIRLMMRTSRGDEARELLTQKTVELPDHAVSRNLLAELLLIDRDFEQALANLNSAIAASPQWWVPHRTKAATLNARGDVEGARNAYEEGMRAAGAAPALGIEYAALLDRLGEAEQAIGVYERLYAANPASELVANNFAMMLANYRTDEASLNQALDAVRGFRNSPRPAFLDTYGWVRLKQGSVDEAVTYLRRAAEGAPENAEIRYHFGMALLESGQTDAARDELNAVIEAAPELPQAEDARSVLQQLQARG